MQILAMLATLALYLVPVAVVLFLVYWIVRKAIRDELGARANPIPAPPGGADSDETP
ncbi:hypothetical protein [Leifsonia sp. Root112D2]|uniref:hypothetical protein n=1 Tax=Leifsonia sp. Root112D2 TaxID=1736426 RepID=UPI000B30B5ED|nr:hypothetical protein [Leifsonia sp. Root112D2]